MPLGLSTLTVALDDLFKWEKVERLDFLKIDVEGAEDKVIEGALSSIKKFRPILQTEGNIDLEKPSNYRRFQALNSANILFIPEESTKVRLLQELGWTSL